jgi:hypothetical protein
MDPLHRKIKGHRRWIADPMGHDSPMKSGWTAV